jgi:hypothetical protein
MDLEKLNTSQIVLLTLLVSFVTSIATGIVTVTLMEQAPPAITQTVNRIVERTVEKVVPEGQVAAASVVTEKVVTVREEDLIAEAVALVDPSIVRLYAPGKDERGNDIQLFVGLAVVMSADGVLIADSGTPEGTARARRSDGSEVSLALLSRNPNKKIIRFQAASTTIAASGEEPKPVSWEPATFTAIAPQLGESIVSIGGVSSTRVSKGIISALADIGETKNARIETSLKNEDFVAGSPLINTDGEIIGLATRESRDSYAGFLASSAFLLDNSTEGGTASQ